MLQLRFDDAVDYGLQLQLLPFHFDNFAVFEQMWIICARGLCSHSQHFRFGLFPLVIIVITELLTKCLAASIVCWQQCCQRFSNIFLFLLSFVQMTVVDIFVFAAVPHSAREACDVRDWIMCHTHSGIGTFVAVGNKSVACQAQENVFQLPVTRYVCTFFLCT